MRMCVLLVDADETQRLLAVAALGARGHDVLQAASAGEALRELARRPVPPQLVACSAALPKGGALQLVLRLGQRWRGLPVVIGAHDDERRVAFACVSAGALALVRAPFDPEELDVWLARALDQADRAQNAKQNAGVAAENAELVRRLESSGRLASLGQLAASIAHEIRNPLNWVLENARYVAQALEDPRFAASPVQLEQLREAARDAVSGAGRIRDLIRDVSTVASPDETTTVPFDVGDAARAAVRMAAAELNGRAQVLTRLGSDLRVVGSVGRMTQVFVNLLVNAAQAIRQEPAREGRIVIVGRRHGDRIVVEVSDDGPGIAPEHAERIFEAFFTTKRQGEGTGLGLFLSRDIVRRHGGELRVHSTPGRGATFTIDLPADARVAPAANRGSDVGGTGSAVRKPSDGTVLA